MVGDSQFQIETFAKLVCKMIGQTNFKWRELGECISTCNYPKIKSLLTYIGKLRIDEITILNKKGKITPKKFSLHKDPYAEFINFNDVNSGEENAQEKKISKIV